MADPTSPLIGSPSAEASGPIKQVAFALPENGEPEEGEITPEQQRANELAREAAVAAAALAAVAAEELKKTKKKTKRRVDPDTSQSPPRSSTRIYDRTHAQGKGKGAGKGKGVSRLCLSATAHLDIPLLMLSAYDSHLSVRERP